MTARLPLFLWLLLSLLALPILGQAQDTGDSTLHVLRPIIHAEQDNAELCLEFDHNIEGADHGHVANSIRLESGGKTIAILPQNISLISTMLCLPALEHRREYRLTVTGLRGSNNEKLVEPYRFSFTIPDRQPALAFLNDLYANGLMRWQDNDPVLRAINVTLAHIELYRITDPALMAEAWRQRLQTTLAPSESSYFARNKGKLVWQGELALGDTPNKAIEQKVPLQTLGTNLPPGFYLVVVSADQNKSSQTDNTLAPLAAAWLLRSDLKVRAVHGKNNFYALTEKADASAVIKDVHLMLLDHNQGSLAEARSDNDGFASIPLDEGKSAAAATLLGFTDAGDVDFVDLTQNDDAHFTLPDIEATLTGDKTFYAPGTSADITLSAHNAEGNVLNLTDSKLLILRPDNSLYATLPVGKEETSAVHVTFPVPLGDGIWSLLWQRSDGLKLAENPFHITSNENPPHFEISADRLMLSEDGELNITLKSITEAGKAAAFLPGHLTIRWETPDHVFPGYEGYFFGSGATENKITQPLVSFITDDKGMDQIHLNLTPPADMGSLHTAIINLESDLIAGASAPAPLQLPVKPKDFIIGIKPLAHDAMYAENSLAHFDIIALDTEGKRRDVDGLTYQIYEEGRSFDWYQAEGRWDYKPLQQQRRIGGSTLTLKADGSNLIDWPVTAGTYRLEIANANGTILARKSFSAGWGLTKTDETSSAPLLLTVDPVLNHIIKINFKLDHPALITAVIADDHIRKIVHQLTAAGDNTLSITADPGWDNSVRISVEAHEAGDSGLRAIGQIIVPLTVVQPKTTDASKGVSSNIDTSLLPLSISSLMPSFLKLGDTIDLDVTLKNNTTLNETYHYNLSALNGLKVLSPTTGSVVLNAGQSRNLFFTVNAVQATMSDIKLEVSGSHNNRMNHTWPLTVTGNPLKFSNSFEETLAPKQSWSSASTQKPDHQPHTKAEAETLFLSPEPLFDFPQILTNALEVHAATTRELANQLGLLRLTHDFILQANVMQEPELTMRQHETLLRLLARQKTDGGFPNMASDNDATLLSTAAALTSMSRLDNPLTKTAEDDAANWLKRHLDNSWFDEKERPERAAAYAALAASDQLDVANLHYFSDTSADKVLPPLAALQLSAAFSKNNDADKARFWLKAAHIEKGSPDIDANLLPLLAENTFFNAEDLIPSLAKLSQDVSKKPLSDFETMARLIRAIASLQNRAGPWRVTLNNNEQNLKNIYAGVLPEKSALLTVHNPLDRALYLAKATSAKNLPNGDSEFTRHIYLLNGIAIMDTDELHRDQTYLVVLEGPWSDSDNPEPLLVHDNPEPALHIASCSVGHDIETNDSLAWIKGLNLTAKVVCEKAGAGIDAVLTHTDGDQKNWRIAYLANTDFGGAFTLSQATFRSLYHSEVHFGHSDQFKIK